MSEYYIGAIRANSNYLAHATNRDTGYIYQTGKRTRGNGWWVDGKLTDAGYEHYYGRKRRSIIANMGRKQQDDSRFDYNGSPNPFYASGKKEARDFMSSQRRAYNLAKRQQAKSPLDVGYQKPIDANSVTYKSPNDVGYQKPIDANSVTYRSPQDVGYQAPVDPQLMTGVERIANSVGNWGKQAVKDVGDWLAKAGDTVKQWLAPAANWVRIKWNKAMNFIKNSNFYKSAQKVVGNIRNWGKTTLYSIRDAARRVGSFVGGFIKGITGRRTGISNYQDSDREAGNAAGSQVRSFGTNIMNQVTGRQAEIDRKAGGAKTSSMSKESRNRNTLESRDMSPISTPQKRIRDRHRTTDRRK